MTCQNPPGRRDRDKASIISHMAGTTAPAKTVVVADDTAFVRERFRTAQEGAGHKAIIVGRATDLVDLIRACGIFIA